MIYRDIDLRHEGYGPLPGVFQYQSPVAAFARIEVRDGDAVVFQIGSNIWAVYRRPDYEGTQSCR